MRFYLSCYEVMLSNFSGIFNTLFLNVCFLLQKSIINDGISNYLFIFALGITRSRIIIN